jgi:hypothetical protein
MNSPATSNQVISTILKHDSKVTNYKIAPLRAINDVVLSFPGMNTFNKDVAVPLIIDNRYQTPAPRALCPRQYTSAPPVPRPAN